VKARKVKYNWNDANGPGSNLVLYYAFECKYCHQETVAFMGCELWEDRFEIAHDDDTTSGQEVFTFRVKWGTEKYRMLMDFLKATEDIDGGW
jgi:hypothetical protein